MPCSISKELIGKTIGFHGHSCPGLAIGIRVSELALQKLGRSGPYDLVAVVETDMCGVDAIQFLTGCTFGKGDLIHKDYGKMAFSFYDRSKNVGFRALLRPNILSGVAPELHSLRQKVADGMANEKERLRYEELMESLQEGYMNADLEEMFITMKPIFPTPKPARIFQSLQCDTCGEMTMETRTRRFDGRTLCLPCFEKAEQKI